MLDPGVEQRPGNAQARLMDRVGPDFEKVAGAIGGDNIVDPGVQVVAHRQEADGGYAQAVLSGQASGDRVDVEPRIIAHLVRLPSVSLGTTVDAASAMDRRQLTRCRRSPSQRHIAALPGPSGGYQRPAWSGRHAQHDGPAPSRWFPATVATFEGGRVPRWLGRSGAMSPWPSSRARRWVVPARSMLSP